MKQQKGSLKLRERRERERWRERKGQVKTNYDIFFVMSLRQL